MPEQDAVTDEACWQLFRELFPHGLHDQAIVEALAPEGWAQSPLVRVYHPTAAQVQDERRRFR
ncbi:MAG: hypothetical protein ABIR36_05760, partial [Nitrospiraceae bacterium]